MTPGGQKPRPRKTDERRETAPAAKAPDPRRMALDVLLKMKMPAMEGPADGYSNLLVDAALKKAGAALSDADRGLFTRLCAGVCERRMTLDYLIAALSARHPSRLDADVLNILRLGLWQLRYADRIPEHAAVNETVALAKKYSRGFVNALLRSYLRRKEELTLPAGESAEALSVRYSVGKELCAHFLAEFGAEKTVRMLESTFSGPKLTLRTNTLRITREALAEKLRAEGFGTEPTAMAPQGLRILSGSGLPRALEEGLCFVQDEASQLAGLALDARPGESVLDLCACPGSKSFGAAMTMEGKGSILSCDLHASKLPLIDKEAKKLGIGIIRTAERDSSVPAPELAARFDRVICDVPCSGFGVIAKKPEIRYKSPAESADLSELQYRILEAGAAALKPGGILVYSTCTVLAAENGRNAEKFLRAHPEFSAEPFVCGEKTAENGMLSLYPDEGTDGFFIARLRKNENS